MPYLSDEEIVSAITDYINEDVYAYAVMLDGEWGSGKTHFVKEKLIPAIKEIKLNSDDTSVFDKHEILSCSKMCYFPKRTYCFDLHYESINRMPVYISLYGINSKNDISNEICLKLVEAKIGTAAKFIPAANTLIKTIMERFNVSSSSKLLSSDLFSAFLFKPNHVLIFDDLERCPMSINDIFGYINQIVEEYSLKVVVVANENEINTVRMSNNLELKYILATDKNICFANNDLKNEESGFVESKVETKEVGINELKKRIKYLFEDDELYKKIKEKLIGKNIYYRPDLIKIVPMIITKCNFDEFLTQNILLPLASEIDTILSSRKHYNIRTLQSSLLAFKKIYTIEPDELKYSINREKILTEIFIAILKVSISFKRGEKNYVWNDDRKFGEIDLNEGQKSLNRLFDMDNYFMSFKFVHNNIYSSVFNEEEIKDTVVSYCKLCDALKKDTNDPVYILTNNYWRLEDEEIKDQLIMLKNKLDIGSYNLSLYFQILALLYKLEMIGFNFCDIKQIVEIMINNINNSKDTLGDNWFEYMSDNISCYNNFIETIKKLKLCEHERDILRFKDKSKKILEAKDLSECLKNLYDKNRIEIEKNKLFFSLIDIDYCIEKLDAASNNEFIKFITTLEKIYKYNSPLFFVKDYDNLNKLYLHMKDRKYIQKMKDFNRKHLVNSLESILSSMDHLRFNKENNKMESHVELSDNQDRASVQPDE